MIAIFFARNLDFKKLKTLRMSALSVIFLSTFVKFQPVLPKSPKRCAWNVGWLVILRSAFNWMTFISTVSIGFSIWFSIDVLLIFDWCSLDFQFNFQLMLNWVFINFNWFPFEFQLIFSWFSIDFRLIFEWFSLDFQLRFI